MIYEDVVYYCPSPYLRKFGLETSHDLNSSRTTFSSKVEPYHAMLFLCFLTRTTRFSFSEATLFFQGYQLLHRMDPFINQMLAEEHWCSECANYTMVSLNERM
ncbi:hypothetical protein IGI04_016876 [Brassica rapa subsp. trilocularis]|uniref:Uncharacterized protein n=1 Tax=Brassica rapa subsp. trilocularis TaxID=1813537 RepID=A0ABQ7MXP0_BRACM|nr:hypothetical protein IGI04_016876 [Brassica rapa subsp. trilocularis]